MKKGIKEVALNTNQKGIRIRKEQAMQWPKEKEQTNNDVQNTTQKTKDQATRTPLKTGSELKCSRRVSSSCPTCDTHRVTIDIFYFTH